ncbi:Spermine/spermidine synthase [Jiangella alkaliphila]|uniref:Spermine/spermidine synthase n=1 Tax=Jiangella alkaliphila TaxID=419479 RepID=A0A1H2JAU1_9ACTN|nr:Spermine/spermidine synthase [Jiangella alkaliphila]
MSRTYDIECRGSRTYGVLVFDTPQTLVRHDGVDGEVVVRRRAASGGPVYELIVNGTFLMDTAETSTERLLGELLLDRHPEPATVLVAGLGFGFTVGSLLADARVRRVDVVEIEPTLVDVLRRGVVPGLEAVVGDPRVRTVVDDVRAMLPSVPPSTYDGILLDVDNGPHFLVHEANAEVYERPLLAVAARALRPGGLLAVWSAAPAPVLAGVLADAVGSVEQVVRTVRRGNRDVDYHVYVARRP